MINLLPLQQKEEIRKEGKLRMILILGVIFIASLVSFSLILLSIKISISAQIETQKIIFDQKEKEFQANENQQLEEKIKDFNITFSKLDTFYKKQFDLVQTLETISKLLPQGAYLTNLNFAPIREGGEFRAQISLSGFSESREILLSFRENLENEKSFSEIDFPPENWVKLTNINFLVNFKAK